MENYMVARIYEHSVYTEIVNDFGGITNLETAESERTFREMVPFCKD